MHGPAGHSVRYDHNSHSTTQNLLKFPEHIKYKVVLNLRKWGEAKEESESMPEGVFPPLPAGASNQKTTVRSGQPQHHDHTDVALTLTGWIRKRPCQESPSPRGPGMWTEPQTALKCGAEVQ
ncbi:hypothetical protein CB1_000310006 [Camelus ferus]|nr:hypothetical protein CB1_000310006 [Camelus ferus]